MAFGKIVIANCDSNYRYWSNQVTWYLRKFRRNNLDWKIEFKSKEMMMPLCVQFDANSFGWEFVWNWIPNLLNDRFDRIGLILIRLRAFKLPKTIKTSIKSLKWECKKAICNVAKAEKLNCFFTAWNDANLNGKEIKVTLLADKVTLSKRKIIPIFIFNVETFFWIDE